MTTIAYRDGVLASDSLRTSNGLRDGACTKIWKAGRILVAAAGSTPLCVKFADWVRGGMEGDCPIDGVDEANGLVIAPDGSMVCWNHLGPWPVKEPFYALGSGYQLAMGAMAMGATAEQAVSVAATYCTMTGGDITVLRRDER